MLIPVIAPQPRRCIMVFLVAILLAISPAVQLSTADESLAPVSLAGVWHLNSKRSDDLESVMDVVRKQDRRVSRSERKSQGDIPRGVVSKHAPNMRNVLTTYVPDTRVLRIMVVGESVSLAYEGSQERTIDTSGRSTAVTAQGAPLDAARNVSIAGWEKNSLFVETTTEQGIRVVESYRPKGDQLRVGVEILYPNFPAIEIERFYDRP